MKLDFHLLCADHYSSYRFAMNELPCFSFLQDEVPVVANPIRSIDSWDQISDIPREFLFDYFYPLSLKIQIIN